MADIEIFGILAGTFRREAYAFERDGRTVTVRERRTARDSVEDADVWEVAVRWPVALDDEVEGEKALQDWFEGYLLASSVAIGSSVRVAWDGIHRYNVDGTWRVGKSLTMQWMSVRRDSDRFDSVTALADAVRLFPEVHDAAEDLRHSMALLSEGITAAAAAAYIAVERLVVASGSGSWQSFGTRLNTSGSTWTADDLQLLWASFQMFRHDPAMTTKAQKAIADLGRSAIDYGRCCWQAAEILEAYVDAKTQGQL